VLASLTMPSNQRIAVRDSDVKRLMKREEEEDVSMFESESHQTHEEQANLRPMERAAMTLSNPVQTDFQSYLPALHPVLDPKLADKDKPVNVRFLMGSTENSQSEFLVQGFERSAYLKLVSMDRNDQSEFATWTRNSVDLDHPIVWMADVESMGMNCHVIESLVKHVQQKSEEDLPTALVLVDYSGSTERLYCPDLEQIIPRDRIRMTRRNIAQNRYWDSTTSWVDAGELAANDGSAISGGPILFAPHMLRDSFVGGLSLAIKKANQTHVKSPVDLKRERDVAHFWRRNDYSHYSFLRAKVGDIVESLSGEKSNGREIHTVVNVLGEVEEMEMNKIDLEYIEQMVGTKIIVVAQRDEWEGSHRLLEALASGAMVIADKALAMPAGLVDRESIVIYDSEQSLKNAIFYYLNPRNDKERLSIARKGWEIALGRHRSWHRVEEIVFGKPLSQVDKPFEPTPVRRKRQAETQEAKQSL